MYILNKLSTMTKNFIKNSSKEASIEHYRDYLDLENNEHYCFICGKKIKDNPHIHHVIPYSYVYSHDLWNLVYTHDSCHSMNSKYLPDEELLCRLEERNCELYKLLRQYKIKDKNVEELDYAIRLRLARNLCLQRKGYYCKMP